LSKKRTTDLRELPAYSIAEAARYLHVAPATLRSWVRGRSYDRGSGQGFSSPLIPLPDPPDPRLSFNNLVEAHVLRALRTDHRVSMQSVRKALDYAEREFDIDRLLIRHDLLTAAGDLFLDRYGQLISLPLSGQLAVKRLLQGYLKRIDRGADGLPVKLYPILPDQGVQGAQLIVIDPRISFGRPVLAKRGISTAILIDRLDAGETVPEIAVDYDLDEREIEEAIVYERAA